MTLQSTAGLSKVDRVGEIGILNVGAGDTKLTFDKEKPADRERAAAIVVDMLNRGYAILVQVGEKNGKPIFMRAESFDPETCEYLIVGLPEGSIGVTATDSESDSIETPPDDSSSVSKRKGRKQGRIKAESTRATAVARSAGG
jgi:hypothetical protein